MVFAQTENQESLTISQKPTDPLKEQFEKFCEYGLSKKQLEMASKHELDNTRFCKLCKDCGLFDTSFTRTDADIYFSKVKTKGLRKISYKQFQNALELVAQKKVGGYSAVKRAIVSSNPKSNATTTPDFVKFHDDKHFMCGVYKRGGPTVVDVSPDLAFVKSVRKTSPKKESRSRTSMGRISNDF